jgi:hypothetical protein
MAVDLAPEGGGGARFIAASYADAGSLTPKILSLFPLIRLYIRSNRVDDEMEFSQPAERAGEPVAMPDPFHDISAFAADELHDRPGAQAIAGREGGPHLDREPVMHRHAWVM